MNNEPPAAPFDEPFDLDLGDGHALSYTQFAPDRSIPANAERFQGIDDIEKLGALIYHRKPDGSTCYGHVYFDTPACRKAASEGAKFWEVKQWEPLTLSPSILCLQCGDHGYIVDGKWRRVP